MNFMEEEDQYCGDELYDCIDCGNAYVTHAGGRCSSCGAQAYIDSPEGQKMEAFEWSCSQLDEALGRSWSDELDYDQMEAKIDVFFEEKYGKKADH